MSADYDPFNPAGTGAIRYALSTSPVLFLMPVGLCIFVGGWLGFVEGGATAGFTVGVLLGAVAEYLRRGTLYLKAAGTRRILLRLLTGILVATPVLSALGVVLGFLAVSNCFGPACSDNDHFLAVTGLIFAILAVIASIPLVSLLRSPIWAQQRAASTKGP